MDPEDQIDDIPITEGEPEIEPARAPQSPGFDPDRFAASIAEGVAKSLAPVFERLAPKQEPQRPKGLGDSLRAKLRDELGLSDDVTDRYTRAAALDALGDEWGDDPAIKGAIKQRTGDARLIEALAEQARQLKSLRQEMDQGKAAEQAHKQRAAQVAQLHQLAESGGLRKVAPNLFAGQMTPAHKQLLESLDVETLERVLPHIDAIVGAARPRTRRLGSSPGGTGRAKPQPFRVVPDSTYDDMIDRLVAGEESN